VDSKPGQKARVSTHDQCWWSSTSDATAASAKRSMRPPATIRCHNRRAQECGGGERAPTEDGYGSVANRPAVGFRPTAAISKFERDRKLDGDRGRCRIAWSANGQTILAHSMT